jgi:hypothetical protein
MKDRKFKFFTVKQTALFYEDRPIYAVVNNRTEAQLGVIIWHAEWRQWMIQDHMFSIWSVDCLRDIVKCLNELNKEAK